VSILVWGPISKEKFITGYLFILKYLSIKIGL